MFSVLGLATPWALLGILITPLLIYAYLKKREGKKESVPSLFILKQLSKKRVVRKKFSPPLRFYLEILALLLLVLAASQPLKEDSKQQIALLIDNSLSMSAGPTLAENRLNKAKLLAKNLVSASGKDSTFTVYETSPRQGLIGSEKSTASQAISSLEKIEISFSADNLNSAINEIQEQGKYNSIHVFTDWQRGEISDKEKNQQLAELLSTKEKEENAKSSINIHSVFQPASNAWISSFSVLAGGALQATAYLNGTSAKQAKLSFFEGSISAPNQLVEIGTSTIKLEPEQNISQQIQLKYLDNTKIYKVLLELVNTEDDAVSIDNTAWVSLKQSNNNTLLIVDKEQTNLTYGLDQLPRIQVKDISLSSYENLSSEEQSRQSLVIFHRVTPEKISEANSLFLLPPKDNKLFPLLGPIANPRITSWTNEHPLMSYLKVPLLDLVETQIFEPPAWAQAILRVEQGAVLLAAESRGVRLAAIGFEILPFEAGKTPALSILTLNLINWLSSDIKLQESLLTASVLDLKEGAWTATLPDGSKQTVNQSTTGLDSSGLTLKLPGIYQLRESKMRIDQASEIIAANTFYPEESTTLSSKTFSASSKQTALGKHKESSELWGNLALLALLVILLELIIASFRQRSGE